MSTKQICEKYIEVIKKSEFHDPDVIQEIMKGGYTPEVSLKLDRYMDYVTKQDDEKFNIEFNQKYPQDESMDAQWEELEHDMVNEGLI